MSQIAYTAFISLIALERLFELRLSKRHYKLAMEAGGREVAPGHFAVMSAMHTLFLLACVGEVWGLHRPFDPAIGWIALGLACLAQGIRYWVIATLKERWNVRIVVLPNAAPVTSGPYRYLRHPNYLAVIVEMIALPLVHGAWLTAMTFSVANAAVLYVRIRAEEAALGAGYQQAFADTHRWLPRRRS